MCLPGEYFPILSGVVSHINSILSGPISQKFKIVVLFDVAPYPQIFSPFSVRFFILSFNFFFDIVQFCLNKLQHSSLSILFFF